VTGTFVVNGSPTKTEMVDSAGGRSQVSQLTAAAIVVVVLLFLTGPLSYMPNAVLASVVFIIGVRLIDYRGMSDIYRVRKGEFAVAAVTAATVVVVGVEQGIILAMALSIIEHIYHSYRPYDELVVPKGEHELAAAATDTGAEFAPGLAVYAFAASLYYANATRFTASIMDIVENADPPLRWLVISGAAIGDVDYSGSAALSQVQEELAAKGTTLVLADINEEVKRELDAYGLSEKIGPANIYESIRDATEAYRAGPGAGAVTAGTATVPPAGGAAAASTT
jgi:MFS superfamily sulfate permease-like transporter